MQLFISKVWIWFLSFELRKANNINNLNEELNGIMKIVKSLEESGLLIKGACNTVKNEAKILKYKRFIKMNLNLMVFIQGIIYLK